MRTGHFVGFVVLRLIILTRRLVQSIIIYYQIKKNAIYSQKTGVLYQNMNADKHFKGRIPRQFQLPENCTISAAKSFSYTSQDISQLTRPVKHEENYFKIPRI